MGKPLIVVSSVTYAIKGRDILFGHGIRAYVERIPQMADAGCGYGIYVPGNADEAERILRNHDVKILDRIEQDGDGAG